MTIITAHVIFYLMIHVLEEHFFKLFKRKTKIKKYLFERFVINSSGVAACFPALPSILQWQRLSKKTSRLTVTIKFPHFLLYFHFMSSFWCDLHKEEEKNKWLMWFKSDYLHKWLHFYCLIVCFVFSKSAYILKIITWIASRANWF